MVSIKHFPLVDEELIKTAFIPIHDLDSWYSDKNASPFDQPRYSKPKFYRNYELEFLNPGLNR